MSKYTLNMLWGIRRALKRRPEIDCDVFSTIKSLGILKPFRSKKKPQCVKIPVVISNRLKNHSVKTPTNFRTLSNLIPIVTNDNSALLEKVSSPSSLHCGLINCRSACNKTSAIYDFILENRLDCVALTETWLSANEEENQSVLSSLVLPNFNICHLPRKTRGGGVGFIYNSKFRAKLDTSFSFSSFECQTVLLDASSFTYRFIIIYRIPPNSKNKIVKSTFIEELGDLLESTATASGKLLLLGDFNVHVDSSNDPESSHLTSLLDSFDMVQHVNGATHIDGHTLDLVVCRATDDIVRTCEVGPFISDHNSILLSLNAGKSHPPKTKTKFRKIKSIVTTDFNNDVLSSNLTKPLPSPPDEIVSLYNTVLTELMDKHAPEKSGVFVQRHPQPWMNESILKAKRFRRKCEGRWRKSPLTVHRQIYKESCEAVRKSIQEAKSTYYIKQINDCNGDQRKLFQIVDKLLGRAKTSILPHYTTASILAETFNNFFITKISKIRCDLSDMESSINTLQCPPVESLIATPPALFSFRPTTIDEIVSVIKKSSKTTCLLDPIPTSLLLDILPTIAPVIAEIVNASLISGNFPLTLKSAIVKPLLKKPGLDTEMFKNYRPVSNLSFLSKVIEKVVAARLLEHMSENNLLDPMQSAYRKGHSTETALLRVHNDILSAVDKGNGVGLILLDLSAAFDTVDHTIFLTFLEDCIGLKGSPLSLLRSYLTNRKQCVSVKGVMSELSELMYGVPQGSVLGPIAFCIYTIPLGAILRHYNINYHIYADDTQLYCSFDVQNIRDVFGSLNNCISDIRSWMIKNKLKINDEKTEFLIISSPNSKLAADLKISIGQSEISPSPSCKSLGVMLDSHMSMDTQIQSVCRSTLFHIRNISAIRQLIPQSAAAQLVHSLVTSRLDYCNSLLYGVPKYKRERLQRVQNIAARVVTLTRCAPENHITPILKSLHWLPIKFRIDFKILLLTYKCVNGLAPDYLCELVNRKVNARPLRSDKLELLETPTTRLKTYGNRTFNYAAATEWNKLPLDIRKSPSVSCFKSKLKTFLFKQHFV